MRLLCMHVLPVPPFESLDIHSVLNLIAKRNSILYFHLNLFDFDQRNLRILHGSAQVASLIERVR